MLARSTSLSQSLLLAVHFSTVYPVYPLAEPHQQSPPVLLSDHTISFLLLNGEVGPVYQAPDTLSAIDSSAFIVMAIREAAVY